MKRKNSETPYYVIFYSKKKFLDSNSTFVTVKACDLRRFDNFFRRFKVRIGLEIGECLCVVMCYATFSPERPMIKYYFLVRQIGGLAWDGS
jgi:hypothetical protein